MPTDETNQVQGGVDWNLLGGESFQNILRQIRAQKPKAGDNITTEETDEGVFINYKAMTGVCFQVVVEGAGSLVYHNVNLGTVENPDFEDVPFSWSINTAPGQKFCGPVGPDALGARLDGNYTAPGNNCFLAQSATELFFTGQSELNPNTWQFSNNALIGFIGSPPNRVNTTGSILDFENIQEADFLGEHVYDHSFIGPIIDNSLDITFNTTTLIVRVTFSGNHL